MKDDMLKNLPADVVSLKDEELENVAGGYLTASQEKMLRDALKDQQDQGVSKEEILKAIPGYYNMLHLLYPNVTQDDVVGFVEDNYGSL